MARSNVITKSCEACGAAFQAKAADIARGWGRFCSKSCKARHPKGESTGAPQPDPMRAYVEDMATRNGWKREEGEGAIEFLMRGAYETGREDTLNAQRQHSAGGMVIAHRERFLANGIEHVPAQWADGQPTEQQISSAARDPRWRIELAYSAPPSGDRRVDAAALERARRAYHNATGIGTSKTGMFAALKAAREPQEGQG